MRVETTLEQALSGTTITLASQVRCRECSRTLTEGDPILAGSEKRGGEWTLTRVVCKSCPPEPPTDTPIVSGRIASTADLANQRHTLTLSDVGLIETARHDDSECNEQTDPIPACRPSRSPNPEGENG
uniref:hypothetical protein n=1 Tax=Natronorarus salvus TaxID=3117733 RepID=UPI002F2631E8